MDLLHDVVGNALGVLCKVFLVLHDGGHNLEMNKSSWLYLNARKSLNAYLLLSMN